MKNIVRNSVFIAASILLYVLWVNGGEQVYGKMITFGIDKFTSAVSSIQRAEMVQFKEQGQTIIYCYYPDRKTNISLEFCLPIVLLLAWHLSLFFDKRINSKTASKMFGINFAVVYFLQILFPLLLFNISQSKVKSVGFFIGLQVFGFIVFFLIIKDSLVIKYKYLTTEPNQQPSSHVDQVVKKNGEKRK
ncbi:MAG TPA: hypothetical protein PKH79_05755 [Prolixibacteraceae bacterium]|nr:hypothetical protein [Prolixibacteraceae bacterium]HPS12071.1 hypothetical protein [Prolixibacteraceae bacterium]